VSIPGIAYVIVNIYVLRVQRSLYISYFKGLLTCGKNKNNIFRIASVVRYSRHSVFVYL
jgi:hypothetical protein